MKYQQGAQGDAQIVRSPPADKLGQHGNQGNNQGQPECFEIKYSPEIEQGYQAYYEAGTKESTCSKPSFVQPYSKDRDIMIVILNVYTKDCRQRITDGKNKNGKYVHDFVVQQIGTQKGDINGDRQQVASHGSPVYIMN